MRPFRKPRRSARPHNVSLTAQADAQSQRRAAGVAVRRLQALESELNGLKQEIEELAQKVVQLQQTLDANKAQDDRQRQQAAAEIANRQARLKRVGEQHDQCRTQNAALYELGQDLMVRYERKGFIETLTHEEPFFQTARVTLENTKAQYMDKLDGARMETASP